MNITVKTQVGNARSYDFDIDSTTTVEQLKRLVAQKTGDSDDGLKDMYFVFDIDTLDKDDETLYSYGVEDKSKLLLQYSNLASRNLGSLGRLFVDVGNNKGLKRVAWAKTAPKWRIARGGLCLEGTCSNERCEGYEKVVVMPVGYGKLDMCDANETITICPICKEYVDPTNCGFNNCWWRFEGIKRDPASRNRAPQRCNSEWKQAVNAYDYFDEALSGSVTWNRLTIEAVKTKPAS